MAFVADLSVSVDGGLIDCFVILDSVAAEESLEQNVANKHKE